MIEAFHTGQLVYKLGLTLDINKLNSLDIVKMEVASLKFTSKQMTSPQLQRLLRPKPDRIKLPSQNLFTFYQTCLNVLVEDLNDEFFCQWISGDISGLICSTPEDLIPKTSWRILKHKE
jgi:hypothetical protein